MSSSQQLTPTLKHLSKDSSIFREDGRIIFPRSDGNASFRKKIKRGSKQSNDEIHICKEDTNNATLEAYKQKVGSFIACDCLDLPKEKDGRPIKWTLDRLPRGYQLTWRSTTKEVLIGSGKKVLQERRRVILSGFAPKKQFNTALEFVPHALWLLSDPTGNKNNCTCVFCTPKEMDWQRSTAELLGKRLDPFTQDGRRASRQELRFRQMSSSCSSLSEEPQDNAPFTQTSLSVDEKEQEEKEAQKCPSPEWAVGSFNRPISIISESSDEEQNMEQKLEKSVEQDAEQRNAEQEEPWQPGTPTGRSTLQWRKAIVKGPNLPRGWEMFLSASTGNVYFASAADRTTQWNVPT